jgi:hypothetical protein
VRVAVLVALLGRAAGAEAQSWEVDLDALRGTLPEPATIETLEDVYRVRVTVGSRTVVADTHLFGVPPVVVPYHNSDGMRDADGLVVERGDAAIAELFPPGEIGIALKHHRPTRRTVSLPYRSVFALREDLKLQDTHVLLVVGIERDGRPGAMTLSSPASYESGRFGTANYPMIFFRLRYPDYLDAARVRAFRDNIRTMAVAFTGLARLPCDYSGGDPVAARSAPAVREHAAMMVRAVAGDDEARSFFTRPENLLYCAELTHLATSAGLLAPLNAATFEPLVGEETWKAFRREVQRHRAGEPNAFDIGENPQARFVELTLAPPDLEPVSRYAPLDLRAAEEDRLAFAPMSLVDMIDLFVRTHLPRPDLGNDAPALQVELLRGIGPGLEALLGLDRLPPDDPRVAEAHQLWARILALVGAPTEDDRALRRRLAPLLDEARDLCRRLRPETAALIPPSLFHAVARGLWSDGLLGLEYAGHGVHLSLVRRADGHRRGIGSAAAAASVRGRPTPPL